MNTEPPIPERDREEDRPGEPPRDSSSQDGAAQDGAGHDDGSQGAHPDDESQPGDPGHIAWYYAVDDTRHGPVPLEQLRSLVRTGELMDSDLIWRDGMDDWAPASELKRLSQPSGVPPVFDSPAHTAHTPPKLGATERLQRVTEAARSGARAGAGWLRQNTEAKTWLIAGFVLVLLARGCDSLGDRRVARLEAYAQLSQRSSQAAYQQQQSELNARLGRMEQDEDAEDARLEVEEKLRDLEESRSDVADAERIAAEMARHHNAMWAYWRQWIAITGVLMATLALGAMALSPQTTDRTAALAMLAIVLWSLLVYGELWS